MTGKHHKCDAESPEAGQEKERHEQPNPDGPYGAWHWLRAAETEAGNVDRGHHAAKRDTIEDEQDWGNEPSIRTDGSDRRVPPAKACGTERIWRVSMPVAEWKCGQDETVANRQDHGKNKSEDAVLSSAATATFVEWIRAKGHGQKRDEDEDDRWDAEHQMLSLRGGDYRRAHQRGRQRLEDTRAARADHHRVRDR